MYGDPVPNCQNYICLSGMRFIDIICNKSHTLTCTHLFRSTLAGEVVVLSASCQVQ